MTSYALEIIIMYYNEQLVLGVEGLTDYLVFAMQCHCVVHIILTSPIKLTRTRTLLLQRSAQETVADGLYVSSGKWPVDFLISYFLLLSYTLSLYAVRREIILQKKNYAYCTILKLVLILLIWVEVLYAFIICR